MIQTMPKILAKLFILLLALPAFALAADCNAPEPPAELPDGKTASKEAMIEGQRTVQSYVKEGDAYVACMDEAANKLAAELKALEQNEDVNPEVREAREAKLDEVIEDRNEIVSQMKRIADGFNKEIDEFQSRGSDGS
jgi:DNA topoisomerase IA